MLQWYRCHKMSLAFLLSLHLLQGLMWKISLRSKLDLVLSPPLLSYQVRIYSCCCRVLYMLDARKSYVSCMEFAWTLALFICRLFPCTMISRHDGWFLTPFHPPPAVDPLVTYRSDQGRRRAHSCWQNWCTIQSSNCGSRASGKGNYGSYNSLRWWMHTMDKGNAATHV